MRSIFLNLISLIGIFIFLNIQTYSQTNVSGFINANTTWDMAGTPYIVVGNVLLSHNYRLTILPGVTVKFDTNTALQIDGELIAIGTPGNHITFTSNKSNPTPGDWGKIHFADTCVNAVFGTTGNYVSGSIMKYCDISYGGGGNNNYGEIHIENSNPYLNHCNISYSSQSGIFSNQSFYVLDSSTVRNNVKRGLNFQSFPPANSDYFIRNDSILENSEGGILFEEIVFSGNYFLFIQNNYFFQNTNWGAIDVDNYAINFIVEDNFFINNTSYTGIVSSPGIQNGDLRCNIFKNNNCRSGALYVPNMNNKMNIHDNLFDNNIAQTNPAGPIVSAIYYTNQGTSFPTNIYNNIFNNNTSAGSCLYFNPMLSNNQILNIYNNNFSNNIASEVITFAGMNISSSSYNFLYMKRNNFNDSATYEIANYIPYGSPNLYLDSNYWGTQNIQYIDSVIYDYFDNLNQSVVYYAPVLTQPGLVEPNCPNFIITDVEKTRRSINFEIYPNPASKYTQVHTDHAINEGYIEVFNYSGFRILYHKIDNTSEDLINLEKISTGMYYVRLFDGNSYSGTKMLVQH